jgi:pimeloyl-ACP methyl ester carboxylesterase
MRPVIRSAAIATVALLSSLAAGPPGERGGVDPAEPVAGIPGLRFEPTGLALLRPYERGKIPVVLIHGLWATPWSWAHTVEGFEADPILRERYQVWTFGYSTGEPILYSAMLLRQALRQAQKQFDPEDTDPAFDRMVLIGHSMGGLLAKTMVQDSRSRLWETISSQPVDRLAGPPETCEILRQCFFYKSLPEVRRVIFIATPHRGSRLDRGTVHKISSRLIRHKDPLEKAYTTLLTSNEADFFLNSFRDGLPTSVDQLAWEHPRLLTLCELGIDPAVKCSSIIADLRDPPLNDGTDGIVPYASAHLDRTSSEYLVHSNHLCQDHPLVIRECRRILALHAER